MDQAMSRGIIRQWHGEANDAEDVLNTVVQVGEAGLPQSPGAYGLQNWTVLPGASPGERRPYLLLMADAALGHDASDQVVEAVFNRRLEQALIYVSRINPAAEGVLIFLARSHYSWGGGHRAPAHLSWCRAWARFRRTVAFSRPDLHLRVSFLNRVREGRRACHFDHSAAPVGGRLLMDWWADASPETQSLFRNRISLIRQIGIDPDIDARFYEPMGSDQPDGCNFTPVMDFGILPSARHLDEGGGARMYLSPDLELPLGFSSIQFNRESGMPAIDGARHPRSGQHFWRPRDMSLFERSPERWLRRKRPQAHGEPSADQQGIA
ncbi:hypothetical protein BBF93_13020 [Hyphomonas sp. CACIAM 19H1]|uniref:hypothetical protein n=1 Tax=Hyphomonas sp. CACIAM 19H1 TaxID=1873716 RepID=UPI000DED574C|nr:hypothetical protein [Hyphomonas sp. CACIAM 19H1]AXE65037.1 hypothetical protein BBF93_13020 [Hyphomonas sp. CACIAM 19H1]